MGKNVIIGGRIHNPEVGNVAVGANEVLDDTKGKKQNVVNAETDAELLRLENDKQDNLTFDNIPTEDSVNPVTSGGVYAAYTVLQQAIDAILTLIPSAASALNQLADKQFVNSSIATSTATFRGTYNLVSDLHLSVTASHADIATALASVVSSADNQDYAFVQVPTSDTSSDIRVTERYKFNGEVWMYEYDLNNSGFTAQQWEAINSTITLALVQKLGALPTAAELATLLLGKQNVLTFDNVPTSGSDNPVKSGGLYEKFTAIDAKMPSEASADNKLVAENRLAAYVGTIIEALDASFNLTSADGHVTFRLTQADGHITSVQIATDDIASASQVSTNTADIAALQAAYAALTQSDIVIVNGALPSSGQQQNVIYRQPDPDHTPPQFYSDYMWNGSTWVLMSTYNNAIDPRPKKASQNLVTSGGVFDNMGALDVSELNATENPHTLATYADLSAALAAIPSDYRKGGMSIKFVSSVDNKYIQARCMAQNFTTDVTQWQGVDDEPIAGSENLVKSGGVVGYLDENYGKYIDNNEFLQIETDSEKKILGGRKKDGSMFENIGIKTPFVQLEIIDTPSDVLKTINSPEWIDLFIDKSGKIINGISQDLKEIYYGGVDLVELKKKILSQTIPSIYSPKNLYVLKGVNMQLFVCGLINALNSTNFHLNIEKISGTARGFNRDRVFDYNPGTADTEFVYNFACRNDVFGLIKSENNTRIIPVTPKSSPSSPINVLCIGDSFTDNEFYPAELRRLLTGIETQGYSDPDNVHGSDNLGNITFIGTQDAELTPNEGYSSQSYKWFTEPSSPFWDPNTNDVSFNAYCSNHSYSKIDVAIILLGTNGGMAYNSGQYVTKIWDKLLEHNPDIKVLILGRMFANPWGAGTLGMEFNQTTFELNKQVQLHNKYYEDLTNDPAYINNFLYVEYNCLLDNINNMNWGIYPVNDRNTNVTGRRATDNAHPSKYGYWQIADAIRPAFHYWCL